MLVNSTYYDSSDISDYGVKKTMAEFTAGPNRHPFDIVLLAEYCGCGDTNIKLIGPCFEVGPYGKPARYYCPGKPEHQLPINFFDDDDIEEFLMNAGLEDAQPESAPTDDDMTPKTRRRWVLGDVIHDAIELLRVKYDGKVDMEYGDIDMDQDIAYQWMELEDGEWLHDKRRQEE